MAAGQKWRAAGAKIFAAAILLAAAAGVFFYMHNRDAEPFSDDASIDAEVVHIAPSVTGRIVQLPIHENQAVKADDVLFEIDPEPYRLHVALATADLKASEALLATQGRTVATETAAATIAREQVAQASASLQLANNTVARLQPLAGKGYVSAQIFDDARTAKKKAETAYTQAVEQAAATRGAIGTTEGGAATVEARRAALALAERDLRNTVVRAPHDGRVTGLNVKTGEYVILAQTLFTLVVTDEWFAVANFRETELPGIPVEACATAFSLIDRRVPIEGKVESIGWGVADQDRINLPRGLPLVAKSVNWVRVEQRFPVRVRLIDPPPELMRAGASASVRIRPKGRC
jgi:multidrug efflux system membrane fusion protein